MSSVFIVKNTAGTLSITLQPGALNGPGSGQRDSDMFLYGLGAQSWGEGVDTNILRLAESFACPEKTGSPAGIPQDETDLGLGLGITNPLDGQPWWNTSKQVLYIYDGTNAKWKQASGFPVQTAAPSDPSIGDLWYDTTQDLLIDENGCGQPVLKVYDPVHALADADGWVVIASEYLLTCGGNAMTADLNMGSGSPLTSFNIINLADPVNPQDAATKNYVDTLSEVYALDDLSDVAVAGVAANHILYNTGSGWVNVAATAGASPVVAKAGTTGITGLLEYDGVSVDLAAIQGGSNDSLVSKEYVTSVVGAGLPSGANNYVAYFPSSAISTPTGNERNGDLASTGTGSVYVWENGGWRQIFPAVYS